MKELLNYGDKRMTVKEVAAALGVAPVTVNQNVSKLYPGLARNGVTTYLDEMQVTRIKQAIEKSGRGDLMNVQKVADTTTDIEMIESAARFVSWANAKIAEQRAALAEAERKNAVLMHVSKTYTATEIAKELGLRSAQELNEKLADMKIQYKQNGTWVPYADYANMGYFEIKQEVFDNGHVEYHRRITQDGRAFILDLLKCY